MQILFIVDCHEGEESRWLSEINEEELNLITPLLEKIKENDGYFPTGQFIYPGESNIEAMYGHLEGFRIINRFLPTPIHGFSKIEEVLLFTQDPISFRIC